MGAILKILGNLRFGPGPIFWLEVVTSGRRARHLIMRALYAGVLLFSLFIVYNGTFRYRTPDIHSVADFTAAFFGTFASVQLAAILLLGPALAAGTIALERERRTIEYLFTTTLSNTEIVLGKLGARVLQIFYLVLAGLPVLALAMLLGGISPQSLVVLVILTTSTALTVAMLSMAISVASARAREAVVRTYLVLIVLLVFPLLGFFFVGTWAYAWIGPIQAQCVRADPFFALAELMEGPSPLGAIHPWESLITLVRNQMILSGVSLVLATLFMRRMHLRQSGKALRKRRWRWQIFRGPVGSQPMLWKEIFAEPASARLGWIGNIALGLIFLAVLGVSVYMFFESISTRYGRAYEQYCWYATFMGAVICSGALLLIAARAACCITSERERECWDSLLSTPLSAHAIVNAKIIGNLWAVRGLLLLLAIVWLPAVALMPSYHVGMAFSLGTLLVLAFFVSTLGVLISTRAKNSLRAMGLTLAISLFVGGGYLFCCVPVLMLSRGPGSDAEIMLAPFMPFLLWAPTAFTIERHSGESGLVAAYILGVFGYLVAAVVLYLITAEQFDGACGRTRPRDWQAGPPVRQS